MEPLAADGEDLRDPILLANSLIAYQYQYNTNIKLHGSLAKKSRYPTMKELYSERLGRTIPNPELKAEHSYNTEIGIVYSKGPTQIQFNAYYNTLRDLIIQRQLGDNTEQLQNIGEAFIRGVELDIHTFISKVLLSANYTLMEAQNTSDMRPNNHLPSCRLESNYKCECFTRGNICRGSIL